MPRYLVPLPLIVVMIVSLLSISCNQHNTVKSSDNDTLILKSLSEDDVLTLNDTISPEIPTPDDSTGQEKIFGGKGKLWRVWEKLHKNCQNSNITKGMIYFGTSNTLGLGTIILYDKDKKKYIPDFPLLQDKFDEQQKKLVFNKGTNSNCTFQQTTKINSDFLIKSNLSQTANGELSGAINTSKTIDSRIDSWQQNILFPSALNTVLASSTDEYFKSYEATAKKTERYIINKEILISGFSATISTSTNISADLKLALQQGITEGIGDTEAKVKFSYVNDRTIKITTVGTFVVFVELYKLF